MSPEAAIVLAERILALGEGVAQLLERVISAAEDGNAERAAHYARIAAIGQASGSKSYVEAAIAGHPLPHPESKS